MTMAIRDHLPAILGFRSDEDGAVTVDWVVLSAAIIGLALAALMPIASGTSNVGDGVGGSLADADVADLDFDIN